VEGRDDLLLSDLAVTEAVSALARRLRQGQITLGIARRVQRVLVAGLDDRTFRRVELSPEVHRRAEHLLLSLTRTPLRAADALHLALALSARAASVASFDTRLRDAAQAIGLATYPT
jgi:hypothetical protein